MREQCFGVLEPSDFKFTGELTSWKELSVFAPVKKTGQTTIDKRWVLILNTTEDGALGRREVSRGFMDQNISQ